MTFINFENTGFSQTGADDAKQSLSNRGHVPNFTHIFGKEGPKNARNNLKILQSDTDIIHEKQNLKFHNQIIISINRAI